MRLFSPKQDRNVWKGIAAGVVGGLAASFTMNLFQRLLKLPKNKTERADSRPDEGDEEPASAKAVAALSEAVLDETLTTREKEIAGTAAHYAFGATSGAIYGAVAELAPQVSIGQGAPFGSVMWLVTDEILVPALGLSKPPTAYPISKHASGLAAHVLYGMTTECVRRSLRRAL